MLLNNIKLWRQQRDYDCLIACCKMVLDYLGIDKNEKWLRSQLTVNEVAPFPHVARLADELGLASIHGYGGKPDLFEAYIESGLPVIVAVDADSPDYWPYVANHAVVIVGFDDKSVFIHDPNQPASPLEVDWDNFMLAWSRRDFQYAVFQLSDESAL